MLPASYASERGLSIVALLPDYNRFPANAEERRDKLRVEDADSAVIVLGAGDAKAAGLVALCSAKSIPVYVVDGPDVVRVRRVADPDEPARRGLPD
jgi:siroheme synthase (precorrin-2 oxidase/ferrochelatase)